MAAAASLPHVTTVVWVRNRLKDVSRAGMVRVPLDHTQHARTPVGFRHVSDGSCRDRNRNRFSVSPRTSRSNEDTVSRESAKRQLLDLLAKHEGDGNAPEVEAFITDVLVGVAPTPNVQSDYAGSWDVRSRVTQKKRGEYKKDEVVTLGQSAFNVFDPTDLQIVVEDVENYVSELEVQSGEPTPNRWSYVVRNQFRTEDPRVDPPLIGYIESYGESALAEDNPNRLDVRFTSGQLVPVLPERGRDEYLRRWKEVFETQGSPPPGFGAKVTNLIAKAFMSLERPSGIDECGVARYSMERAPKGYQDLLYLDDDMRITRGNRGTVVVVVKSS
eukprot:CAMPEP_0118938490 /NCGR_PEP_ID=MMETSP1169-20130426/26125_1 /TAXON_ID=36882 /ORGANISM="Pyramimonas obovata, Strain CCMP722" /LENGTH=329 /DNA_ID=CAMNT_0006882441 /DNA_START=184 /DNA_END=1169 /DNA_ORIENTATION=-